MNVDACLGEIANILKTLKSHVDREKQDVQEFEAKVSRLVNDYGKKESPEKDSSKEMKISISPKSVLNSLYREEPSNGFFFKGDQESKRKLLVEERRAEYNAFLEKKERELSQRRKVLEERRIVAPRSLLEFTDYENILAQRKQEETAFRNVNCADPVLEETLPLKSKSSMKENINLPSETSIRLVTDSPQRLNESSRVENCMGNRRTAMLLDESPGENLPFISSVPKKRNDSYREELRQQIEDRERALRRHQEAAREEEERTSRRIEEQRMRMQQEYENELKQMQQAKHQRQRERVKNLEEFQRKDAALREQMMKNRRKGNSDSDDQQSRPRTAAEGGRRRGTSPPVPAVRSKVILEKAPTSVARALCDVKPENVFCSLAELRKTIMEDQHKLKRDQTESYEVMNRRTVRDERDEDDTLLHNS